MTKKVKIAIIIAVIVVLLGAIAFGAYYFVFREDECIEEVNNTIPEIPEINRTPRINGKPNPNYLIKMAKPIIYLYPTETTEVSVTLPKKELITCSYPKYTDGWKVKAEPNGDLIDLTTNRELYALYYESENAETFKVEKHGFVIKGEDSASFLEEKLATLGLTPREAEEFIVYWLPKLEANNYNYIRFATMEEINRNMPIEITPNPDTLIRVLMVYKGLDNSIEVNEQKLITPERKGFVAVEWGGTEI